MTKNKRNPFPGMNPFIEQRWRDAHATLITYLRDAIQEQLPEDLVAGAEEETIAVGTEDSPSRYRPDLQVREPWSSDDAGGVAIAPPVATQATKPLLVIVDEEVERWIEIHDETGRLVTALELVSPGNKQGADRRKSYQAKRRTFLGGDVNLVEVDLVREGEWLFPQAVRDALKRAQATYGICVTRAEHQRDCEAYPIRLRERLPVIRVPLRPADADVVLNLQPLIDQCHERGRYHRLRYDLEPTPPFSPDDAAWVDDVLKQHGLRR